MNHVNQTVRRISIFFFMIFSTGLLTIPRAKHWSGLLLLAPMIMESVFNRNNKKIQISESSKNLLLVFSSLALLLFIDSARSHHFTVNSEYATRILLCWLFYYFIRKTKITPDFWFIGIAAGSILTFFLSFYQVFFLHDARAQGNSISPVPYGQACAIFMAICLSGIFQKKMKFSWKIFLFTGAICALFSLLLSGTRGAWIYIPFIMVIISWAFIKEYGNMKYALPLIVFLVLSISSLQLSKNFDFASRMSQITLDIKRYQEDNHSGTSIGSRFLMWSFALDLIKKKPVFGWGETGYGAETIRAIKDGRGDSQFQSQPHNEFLNFAAKFGIPGIMILIMVYMMPIHIARKRKEELIQHGQYGLYLSTMLIPIGYLFFGLSDSTIIYSEAIIIYFYFLTFLAAWIDVAIPFANPKQYEAAESDR